MIKLTADKALELLLKDVIHNKDDLEKPENRWVKHCIFVAIAAGRIAEKMGLDSDYAVALGYIHDIGRKIKHLGHPIWGFHYMVDAGFKEEARSCITHSFIDNDIELTAGGSPTGDAYTFMKKYLSQTELTPYDNIVQLCDLFCLETGFTTIEKRLLDITKRKGVFPSSVRHFESVISLKERLEKQMKCSLYDLFPEINEDDIKSIEEEHKMLLEMLNPTEFTAQPDSYSLDFKKHE